MGPEGTGDNQRITPEDPAVWPPPPIGTAATGLQAGSAVAALGAGATGLSDTTTIAVASLSGVAAGFSDAVRFSGGLALMLWLAWTSVLLNVISLILWVGRIKETEYAIWPAPLRPLQIISLLAMIAGAIAGHLGQSDTLVILAMVSFAANLLSLWLERCLRVRTAKRYPRER